MSRLCFGLLILGILGLDVMSVLLGLTGRLPDAWVGHLTTVALASFAGVYGANSVVEAWRSVGEKVKHVLRTSGKKTTPDFPDE